MNCPYCGADNREKAKFCRMCAKRIDGQTGPSIATEKVNDENKPSSKKTVYFAIPILLVLVIGGWIFANSGSSSTSSVAPKIETATSTSSSSSIASTSSSSPVPPTTPSQPSSPPATVESSVNKMPESQASTVSSTVATSSTIEEKPPTETLGTNAVASNETPNVPDEKAEKKVVKSPPKKEVKKAQSNVKPQPKPNVASSSSTTTSQYQEPKVPQKNSFASEMDACKTKSLFAKGNCESQVRAKYCAGKWGSTPECPAQQSADPSDGRG